MKQKASWKHEWSDIESAHSRGNLHETISKKASRLVRGLRASIEQYAGEKIERWVLEISCIYEEEPDPPEEVAEVLKGDSDDS